MITRPFTNEEIAAMSSVELTFIRGCEPAPYAIKIKHCADEEAKVIELTDTKREAESRLRFYKRTYIDQGFKVDGMTNREWVGVTNGDTKISLWIVKR